MCVACTCVQWFENICDIVIFRLMCIYGSNSDNLIKTINTKCILVPQQNLLYLEYDDAKA